MAFANPALIKLKRGEILSKEEEIGLVTFDHWKHQELFKCYTCHSEVFSCEKQDMSMNDLENGKYCAVCHNGNISWDFKEVECEVCHR